MLILVLVLFAVFSFGGPWAVSRMIPLDRRRRHNDVMAAASGIVGVINAVLLAFIVFAAWTDYDRARDAVTDEAGLVSDIIRDLDAATNNDSAHDAMIPHLRNYLVLSINSEWPQMAQGAAHVQDCVAPDSSRARNANLQCVSTHDTATTHILARYGDTGRTAGAVAGENRTFRAGWQQLRDAYEDLLNVKPKPTDPGQTIIMREELGRFDALYTARRTRIGYATHGSLTGVVWVVVLLGGVLTVACCWLYGFEDMSLHYTTTAILTGGLALVFYLIMCLDAPFSGPAAITADQLRPVLTRLHATELRECVEHNGDLASEGKPTVDCKAAIDSLLSGTKTDDKH